jgi:hypothetical protein
LNKSTIHWLSRGLADALDRVLSDWLRRNRLL